MRKLREMRMALELDKALPKAEILTRYLNLVSFGNGAFGVQEAARTYFGVNAADLNWQQAALLAGMVQSTSALNPYTNPQAPWNDGTSCSTPSSATSRRRPTTSWPPRRRRWASCRAQPAAPGLHRRRRPRVLLRLRPAYLARAGLTNDDLARNGYLIRTTLDPKVQDTVKTGHRQGRRPRLCTASPA